MAENAEKLMEKVGAAGGSAGTRSPSPVGVARIDQFSWKAILDFLHLHRVRARCSDNCPAHRTGKILSPKHLTLALRDHLYGREDEFVAHRPGANGANGAGTPAAEGDASGSSEATAAAPLGMASTNEPVSPINSRAGRDSPGRPLGVHELPGDVKSSVRCSSPTSTRSSTCCGATS